jgi:pSer/pThr/pTyr-binding forkhead associated (FHA) protein
MKTDPHGELVPIGGGDSIPLTRSMLSLGRRRSCDIFLDFPNVSSVHCELQYKEGYWYIQDKNSTNGTKVNNLRVATRKLLIPGDEIGIAKRRFTIKYTMPSDKRLEDFMDDDILSKPLLERAGLQKGRGDEEYDDE